jgi:hypothetical protein
VKGFDYIRKGDSKLQPRTPRTALRAVEEGMLPIEAFIYRAGAIRPLFEEPWDLDEIQRMLSKPELGIESMKNLFAIFMRMTKSKDRELAQFGAESMIELENRVETAIEASKRRMTEEKSAEAFSACARLYCDRAAICVQNPASERFYLKEAYYLLRETEKNFGLGKETLKLAIRILIDLGLFAQAKKLLAPHGRLRGGACPSVEAAGEDFGIFAAEIAFHEKNLHGLVSLIADRTLPAATGGERREIFDFLLGLS